jgi:hypothetical protein
MKTDKVNWEEFKVEDAIRWGDKYVKLTSKIAKILHIKHLFTIAYTQGFNEAVEDMEKMVGEDKKLPEIYDDDEGALLYLKKNGLIMVKSQNDLRSELRQKLSILKKK